MLRVHLVMGCERRQDGSSAPEFSATRIYTVPSQMMPVIVQRGVGGRPRWQPGGRPWADQLPPAAN